MNNLQTTDEMIWGTIPPLEGGRGEDFCTPLKRFLPLYPPPKGESFRTNLSDIFRINHVLFNRTNYHQKIEAILLPTISFGQDGTFIFSRDVVDALSSGQRAASQKPRKFVVSPHLFIYSKASDSYRIHLKPLLNYKPTLNNKILLSP